MWTEIGGTTATPPGVGATTTEIGAEVAGMIAMIAIGITTEIGKGIMWTEIGGTTGTAPGVGTTTEAGDGIATMTEVEVVAIVATTETGPEIGITTEAGEGTATMIEV
eukprot:gnl/TRDRNA2_/TRDRNA2_162837_c1_seq2.p4 gnl/TRDRNA2_/TRDRNA2_162837_c1~~gnl/TRDRNA2_/TRDRNA2_162837_c1_seq2.p4  ORF type:complete len:108 (+),score=4.38 gnl/TRDRNA2_/TRDRNA2_162837_c1_seq2:1-324(+)